MSFHQQFITNQKKWDEQAESHVYYLLLCIIFLMAFLLSLSDRFASRYRIELSRMCRFFYFGSSCGMRERNALIEAETEIEARI